MKNLILFSGLPGVGKSTISIELSKRTEAKIVDLDDFKKVYIDSTLVKSQIDSPEMRWSYYQKALDYVFELFDKGTSMVIMDEVFHLELLRARLEASCKEQCVRALWVEVVSPYRVIDKRLHSKERKGHILSTEESLKMNLLFQEIFEEFSPECKNHIVISNENTGNIDLLVESILKKLS